MNKKDYTLQEMIAGMVLYGILGQVIILFIASDIIHLSAGLWIGVFAGMGIGIHMKRSIEDALDLGEGRAVKHMQKMYALRYGVTAVVFAAAIYYRIGNPLAILAGVLSLKISAYLQPHMHKLFLKIQKSK